MLRSKWDVDHVKRTSRSVTVASRYSCLWLIRRQTALIWTSQASDDLTFRHSPFIHSIECVLNKLDLYLLAAREIYNGRMSRSGEGARIESLRHACYPLHRLSNLHHIKRIHVHLILDLGRGLRNGKDLTQHRV